MKLDLNRYGKKFDSSLPKSLWGKILKNVIYIFLRYQLKYSLRTPLGLSQGNPNIRHMHIWGCLAEVMPYRLHEGKLDLKIISYNFFVTFKALACISFKIPL